MVDDHHEQRKLEPNVRGGTYVCMASTCAYMLGMSTTSQSWYQSVDQIGRLPIKGALIWEWITFDLIIYYLVMDAVKLETLDKECIWILWAWFNHTA